MSAMLHDQGSSPQVKCLGDDADVSEGRSPSSSYLGSEEGLADAPRCDDDASRSYARFPLGTACNRGSDGQALWLACNDDILLGRAENGEISKPFRWVL